MVRHFAMESVARRRLSVFRMHASAMSRISRRAMAFAAQLARVVVITLVSAMSRISRRAMAFAAQQTKRVTTGSVSALPILSRVAMVFAA